MLVDTHCHLHFEQFDADRQEVIGRAHQAGVKYLVNVGTDFLTNQAAYELAMKHKDFMFHTAGLHPHHAHEISNEELAQIKKFIQDKKPYAIGEVGLDYFKSEAPVDIQKEKFSFMIDLAIQKNLPLIVHSRNAFEDTYEILKNKCRGTSLKGVMHCYSYDIDSLKKILDLGFFASFTANITYKSATNLLEVAKFIPLDQMMLETDSPYLAPQNFRGKRNEPMHLAHVADFLAKERAISIEALHTATTQNAIKLFKLPAPSNF